MSSGNVTQRGTNGRHQVLHRMGLSGQAACAHLHGETHGPLKFGDGLIISFLLSFLPESIFKMCIRIYKSGFKKSTGFAKYIS